MIYLIPSMLAMRAITGIVMNTLTYFSILYNRFRAQKDAEIIYTSYQWNQDTFRLTPTYVEYEEDKECKVTLLELTVDFIFLENIKELLCLYAASRIASVGFKSVGNECSDMAKSFFKNVSLG